MFVFDIVPVSKYPLRDEDNTGYQDTEPCYQFVGLCRDSVVHALVVHTVGHVGRMLYCASVIVRSYLDTNYRQIILMI